MKTTNHKLLLFLFLTLTILFLTSCYDLSDDDWELVEVAFESWAEQNGLLENDQWKPDGIVVKAVENTINDITNDENTTQLDGLDVIRDIEKADQLASEGLSQWDKDKMWEAKMLRPRDWRIWEQHTILEFDSGGLNVKNGFEISDNLVAEQIHDGNCAAVRQQQLEYRMTTLENSITNCSNQRMCDVHMMKAKLDETVNELVYLREKGNSIFCDQLKYK